LETKRKRGEIGGFFRGDRYLGWSCSGRWRQR